MTLSSRPLSAALLGLALVGTASAAEIKVSSDITTSTIWTSNNTYNLQKQIFVRPGATLTIQAGTIIASDTGVGGSLAVSRGAQIFVQGTAENPVIMTSKADVATWTNGDPRTGKWREAANEWGNLTIMGRAYISEDATPGNTKDPNPSNVAQMEGLTAAFPGDPKVLYGGGNDDDDSGSISYLSLRFGGKVIALTNELNGLSLGGIGRGTDISYVEIMNNVDDGIEIWGGTFNLKQLRDLEHRRRQPRHRPGLARQDPVRPHRPGLQPRREAGLGCRRQHVRDRRRRELGPPAGHDDHDLQPDPDRSADRRRRRHGVA